MLTSTRRLVGSHSRIGNCHSELRYQPSAKEPRYTFKHRFRMLEQWELSENDALEGLPTDKALDTVTKPPNPSRAFFFEFIDTA